MGSNNEDDESDNDKIDDGSELDNDDDNDDEDDTSDGESNDWISMVAEVNDNLDAGNDNDICDDTFDSWLDIQKGYDLEEERVYIDDEEPQLTFSCMTFTGQGLKSVMKKSIRHL